MPLEVAIGTTIKIRSSASYGPMNEGIQMNLRSTYDPVILNDNRDLWWEIPCIIQRNKHQHIAYSNLRCQTSRLTTQGVKTTNSSTSSRLLAFQVTKPSQREFINTLDTILDRNFRGYALITEIQERISIRQFNDIDIVYKYLLYRTVRKTLNQLSVETPETPF